MLMLLVGVLAFLAGVSVAAGVFWIGYRMATTHLKQLEYEHEAYRPPIRR